MKKFVALLLALMMACAMLPAMAEAAEIPGTWYLIEITAEGITLDPTMFGVSMTFDLKEDGTFDATIVQGEGEDPTNGAGTWENKDGNVDFTIEGQTITLAYADGKLSGEFTGMGGITLSKEAPVAAALPVAVPAESEEAFFGTWEISAMNMAGVYLPFEMLSALLGDTTVTFAIEAGKAVETDVGTEETTTKNYTTEFKDGTLVMTAPSTIEGGEDVVLVISLNDDGSISFANEELGATVYFIRVPETVE